MENSIIEYLDEINAIDERKLKDYIRFTTPKDQIVLNFLIVRLKEE